MGRWIVSAEYGDGFLEAEVDDDDLETKGQVIEHVLENIQIWADRVEYD